LIVASGGAGDGSFKLRSQSSASTCACFLAFAGVRPFGTIQVLYLRICFPFLSLPRVAVKWKEYSFPSRKYSFTVAKMPFLSEFLRVIFAVCAEFVRKMCGTDAICSGKRAFFEHFSPLGNCEIQNLLG